MEDHYRQIYFEALDLAITSIEDRFSQPGYLLYQNLEELLIKAANKKDYTIELQEFLSFYGNDFNDSELSTKLEIFGSCFTPGENSEVTLKEAIDYLRNLTGGEPL